MYEAVLISLLQRSIYRVGRGRNELISGKQNTTPCLWRQLNYTQICSVRAKLNPSSFIYTLLKTERTFVIFNRLHGMLKCENRTGILLSLATDASKM